MCGQRATTLWDDIKANIDSSNKEIGKKAFCKRCFSAYHSKAFVQEKSKERREERHATKTGRCARLEPLSTTTTTRVVSIQVLHTFLGLSL